MHDAIILAGGENNKQLHPDATTGYEALIEIGGKPMVSFVAEALAMSSQVERIWVIGPEKELKSCPLPPNTTVLQGGETIMDTIRKGMAALGHSRPTLVATADIPLLTKAAVDDFLEQCRGMDADLYYPIIPKTVNDRLYPGVKRTYVRLREGVFTGGNLFLVNPSIVPRCMEVANRIIAKRKSPFQLCCILGWSVVLKYILGLLTLQGAERRVSELMGIRGAVIQSRYAELGIDIDKPSDLELVRLVLTARP